MLGHLTDCLESPRFVAYVKKQARGKKNIGDVLSACNAGLSNVVGLSDEVDELARVIQGSEESGANYDDRFSEQLEVIEEMEVDEKKMEKRYQEITPMFLRNMTKTYRNKVTIKSRDLCRERNLIFDELDVYRTLEIYQESLLWVDRELGRDGYDYGSMKMTVDSVPLRVELTALLGLRTTTHLDLKIAANVAMSRVVQRTTQREDLNLQTTTANHRPGGEGSLLRTTQRIDLNLRTTTAKHRPGGEGKNADVKWAKGTRMKLWERTASWSVSARVPTEKGRGIPEWDGLAMIRPGRWAMDRPPIDLCR